MNHRIDDSGIVIATPTRADVQNLKVGDLALDCFGRWNRVTEIYAQKDDINGKAFVCFYAENGPGSTMSHSYKEDETVATVPLTSKYHRSDSVRA